ncbi:MAG: LPS-assembly protein LptD [Deltaproteobacteria bacterium]|nr:LPS-assembly protein LptD [Deltaproteobacteria bacterium]
MLRRGIVISLCLLSALLLEAGALLAGNRLLKDRILEDKNAGWQISANKMSYLEQEGLFMAEGDVVVTRNGQVLYAQKAVYNEKTGMVEVSGDVRFQANGDFLTGERAIFDLRNHTGQITKARLFLRENHYYVNGETIERTGPDTYLVRGGRITTCEGETPDWSITASEVKVTIEGYGTVKGGVFRIRDVPVLYVPYGIFPAKTKRQSGLLPPGMGYSSRNGVEVELPIFWAISDQTDATFYEHYISKRGLKQGVELRYVAEEKSKGSFLYDILSDRIDEKDMGDPDQMETSPYPRTNRTRYWLRSRTDQAFPLGVRAKLDTDFVSDQDYLREFTRGLYGYRARPDLREEFGRPMEDIYSPTRRSAFRLSRDGAAHSLQAQSAYHQRPQNPAFDDTPQPLGGLLYSWMPRSVPGSPLFFKFDTDYDYVWRDVGRKGHSASFHPEVSSPFWLGPYVEFEPSVGFVRDTQWYERADGGTDEQSRDAYEIQGRLSTLLERTFDVEWGEVKRLKHKVFPSLAYRYRGYRDPSKSRPWFEPVDARGGENVVEFSLENFLDTRREDDKGEVTYAQWGTFSLSQGYDITEARRDEEPGRKEKPFLPLQGILTYHPSTRVDLDTEVWWDHYQGCIIFADVSGEYQMARSGGRFDRYGLEHQYVKGGDRSIGGYAHVNLAEGFAVGASQHRSLNLKYRVGSTYWAEYRSQCWGVRVAVEDSDGIESVMVGFSLMGLGDLGKW